MAEQESESVACDGCRAVELRREAHGWIVWREPFGDQVLATFCADCVQRQGRSEQAQAESDPKGNRSPRKEEGVFDG
jgi:hypothetical protein